MADLDRVEEAVVNYFKSKGEIPAASREQILSFAYLDAGFIDSMGIITMVMTLEQEFNIQIGPDQLQSDEFRTIGGIVGIIRNLLQGVS